MEDPYLNTQPLKCWPVTETDLVFCSHTLLVATHPRLLLGTEVLSPEPTVALRTPLVIYTGSDPEGSTGPWNGFPQPSLKEFPPTPHTVLATGLSQMKPLVPGAQRMERGRQQQEQQQNKTEEGVCSGV